jgi:methyl-accepting chemotaxis protein
MRNLKVWQKLALMGVIFLIPFGFVTMKMMSAIDTLGVDFAAQELRGLEFTGPTLALVKNLQEHRDVASLVLSGDVSYRGRLDGVRVDVEKDLASLDELDRRLGTLLRTTARWKAIRTASTELLSKSTGLSPDESFARHSRLIGDVITLVAEVGRSSNLTLDPDAGRAHLATVLISRGPELSELLARARGMGAGLTITSSRDHRAGQIEQLNRQSILMESVGVRLDASMTSAMELTPFLKRPLDDSAMAASDAVLDAQGEIIKLTGRALRGDGAPPTTPDAYFAAMTRGIESINGLESRLEGALQSLLTEHMARLQREVRETLGWAIVGLLVTLLIGIYVMRDVTVTLRDVVTVANHIAAGDLSVRVQARERRDELGVLGQSFDQMIASIKEMVATAERIAAGDLAVVVTPRSERDALGHALSNMAGRLSGLLSDVHRSGIQVNTSVNEIAASAREQEATATEVAAATTEIAATSREIAATSQELVRTMGEVFTAAEESAALAGQGQAGLTRMEATMHQVMEASSSINNKLAVLNEKAGNINHVVTTITKVADQTNLLSLNAAIEAEKAGEYGRGFAVVATEIRRLADQTAVATYDIDRMVKEIQSAVAAGVMGMDKFSDEVRRGMHEIEAVSGQLTQIIQQVQALAPRCEAVSEGMQAQATGAGQITEALSQLSDAAQQTIQSLRQSTVAIDGLNQAATSMHGGVSRFKLAAA